MNLTVNLYSFAGHCPSSCDCIRNSTTLKSADKVIYIYIDLSNMVIYVYGLRLRSLRLGVLSGSSEVLHESRI